MGRGVILWIRMTNFEQPSKQQSQITFLSPSRLLVPPPLARVSVPQPLPSSSQNPTIVLLSRKLLNWRTGHGRPPMPPSPPILMTDAQRAWPQV